MAKLRGNSSVYRKEDSGAGRMKGGKDLGPPSDIMKSPSNSKSGGTGVAQSTDCNCED
jgi:hypothetical protein